MTHRDRLAYKATSNAEALRGAVTFPGSSGHDQRNTQSDGYGAYDAYVANNQVVKQAQCWAHTRRYFEEARDADPTAVDEALTLIGALYHHEQVMRDQGLEGEPKLAYRTENTEPIVKAFWRWCDAQCHRPVMAPRQSAMPSPQRSWRCPNNYENR